MRYPVIAAVVVMQLAGRAVVADPAVFPIRVPGTSGMYIECPAIVPDGNCDGAFDIQDAIWFADQCAGLSNAPEHNVFNPADCSDPELRGRKAVACAEAFIYLAKFGSSSAVFGTGSLGISMPAGCTGSPPAVDIQCSGQAIALTAAVVQHVSGLAYTPAASLPSRPPNAPSGGIVLPGPVIPPATPLPGLFNPTTTAPLNPGTPVCEIPPEDLKPVLPGGDTPLYCAGVVTEASNNTCTIPAPAPEPNKPDIVYCFGDAHIAQEFYTLISDGCNAPTVDPDAPPADYPKVPPSEICAAINCTPTCSNMPCSELPTPMTLPEDACAGLCDLPATIPQDVVPTQPGTVCFGTGVCDPPKAPILPPKEREPEIWLGNRESASIRATLPGHASGNTPLSSTGVELATGVTLEQAADLTISLAGQDFSLVRNYSSSAWSIGNSNPGLFGVGWSSPSFQELIFEPTSGDLLLANARANAVTRYQPSGTDSWTAWGPGHESVTRTTSGDYLLTIAGVGRMMYFGPQTSPVEPRAGRIAWEEDEHGNRRTYVYRMFTSTGGSGTTVRLHRIYLNGSNNSDSAGFVQFGYYFGPSASASNAHPDPAPSAVNGRVARVMVYRFGSGGAPIETHRVEYTYKRSGDGLSADLGTDGDLVQVVKYSFVDPTLGASNEVRRAPHEGETGGDPTDAYGPSTRRTAITQYRYHAAASKPTTGDVRLDANGPAHALKSILRPEQIESYAELLQRENPWVQGTSFAVRDGAYRLLLLRDHSMAVSAGCGHEFSVADLCSKVSGYVQASVGGAWRVSTEAVQTGRCGCEGPSQQVKCEYSYSPAWTAGSDPGISVRVDEFTRPSATGTWSLNLTRFVDSQQINGSGGYYGVNDVIQNPAATSQLWVKHFRYDTSTRNLLEEWTPGACKGLTYTPASFSGSASAPSLVNSTSTPSTSNGPIRYFHYNTNKRLDEVGVILGGTSIPSTRIAYGSTDTGAERTYLPKKVERFVGTGTSPSADEIEATMFAYTFSSSHPDSVKSVLVTREGERPQENGPASGTHTSMTLLNELGQAVWSGAPDGTLRQTTYDAVSGRVTGVVLNADGGSAIGSTHSSEYTAFKSANGLGSNPYHPPSLSYSIARDNQGRITSISAPDPTGSAPITDQWAYGYGPIDKPGIDERFGAPFPYYVHLPASWMEGETRRFAGPISVVWTNCNGAPIHISRFNIRNDVDYTRANAMNLIAVQSNSNTSLAARSEIFRTIIRRSPLGALTEYETWNDVTGAWNRPTDQRSYKTVLEYDTLGRVTKQIGADGEISANDRDFLGRVTVVKRGTTDGNLLPVARFYYDADPSATTLASGVGNGNLRVEEMLLGSGSTDLRRTVYTYDGRDRLVSVQNPLAPHQFYERDNLGRITTAADFTGSTVPTAMSATDRGRYVKFSYSQRGLPYRTQVAIDPGDDEAGYLESHNWFDGNGRVIASWGPDSPAVKRTFDALGRVAVEYVTDRNDDPLPLGGSTDTWTPSASVADDTVLEQTEYEYSNFGPLSFVRHIVRRHDAVASGSPIRGALTFAASGGSGPTGIATYTGYSYDAIGRLSRSVDFGTNRAPGIGRTDDAFGYGVDPTSGSSPVWPLPNGPSTRPEWNGSAYANHLVSGWEYNPRGLLDAVSDPKGRKSRVVYDDEEDPIASIENAVSTSVAVSWDSTNGRWGVTGLSSPDQDRVTTAAVVKLDASAGWVSRRAAHFPTVGSASAQVTEVLYGVSVGSGASDSLINSFSLPKEVHFPNLASGEAESGTGTSNTVKYSYNRLGELKTAIDRNTTTHAYTRDALGRVTIDTAAEATGVDGTVASITASFDALGRLTDVRSKDDSSTVLDHVRFGRDALGLLTTIEQDVDSDLSVSSGQDPKTITYEYDRHAITGSGTGVVPNSARVRRMHMPAPIMSPTVETALRYDYGTASTAMEAVNRAIGRVSGLIVEDSTGSASPTTYELAEYSHIGLSAFSHIDLGEIDAQLDRTIDRTGKRNYGATPPTPQDAGVYPGFDRFGRLKRQAWVLGSSQEKVVSGVAQGVPNMRELVNLSYYYDAVGNITHKRNDQQGAGVLVGSTPTDRWPDRDWVYQYDGLDRLTQAARGVIAQDDGSGSAGAFTSATPPSLTLSKGSRKWELDTLGNWSKFGIDFNNNGSGGVPAFETSGSGKELEDRSHNQQNQLDSLPSIPAAAGGAGGAAGVPYAVAGATILYDANGSRIESGWTDQHGTPSTTSDDTGFRFRYTYDAWNRLVKITRAIANAGATPGDGDYKPIAEYRYNGLNHRVSKLSVGAVLTPTSLSDATPLLSEQRYYYYDAAWRAVVEEVDDNAAGSAASGTNGMGLVSGIDRRVQQFFGLRGVNDALFRREDRAIYHPPGIDPITEDPIEASTDSPNGEYEFAIYQLSDPQLSVVSVVKMGSGTTGRVVDQVEYDPYGNPRRTPQGDFNHNGSVSVQDYFDFLTAYFAGDPAADENDTGTVSVQDIFDFVAEFLGGDSTPTDRISGRLVGTSGQLIDNPYGYCGYYFDGETAAAQVLGPGGGGLYQCRYRVYDPMAGRWLQQDPAGFVDGSNLYEYCGGDSINCFDPAGLDGSTIQITACNEDDGKRQHSHAAGAPSGSPEEMLDRIKDDFRKVVDQKVMDGTLSGSEAFRILATSGYGSSTVSEVDQAFQQGLTQGGHDGAIAWAEGFVNAAIDSAIQTSPLLDQFLGRDTIDFHVDFSEAMYDPETQYLNVSRTMGKVSFEALAMAAAELAARTPSSKCGSDTFCFVAGTVVWTDEGTTPIEDLKIGDRVKTRELDEAQQPIKSGLLWALDLTMPNPLWPDDTIEIRVLRSPDWVWANGAFPGHWIEFILPEMGLQGQASVQKIDDCPPIKSGAGRLVLATVTHLNGSVLTIHFEGTDDTLEPTATHPLFSVDRADWIPASHLRTGERLQTAAGEIAIADISSKPGIHRVYNLEVQTEHWYFAGKAAVQSHNVGRCSDPLSDGVRSRGHKLGQAQGREFQQDWLKASEYDPNLPSHIRGWLKNERRRLDFSNGKPTTRNAPGYVMGHGRSTPAREGFDYSNARIQAKDLNDLEESVRRASKRQ